MFVRHPGLHPAQKCIPRPAPSPCTRTCAYTLQQTHSTCPTLAQILAGRKIWHERTPMVMLSFLCKKTEEAGSQFHQAASDRPGPSQFLLCWRTLRQHLALWGALISSCFLLRSQIASNISPIASNISPISHFHLPGMKSCHSGCASAPAGTGEEAKLPIAQGCSSEKGRVFSSAGVLFQGEENTETSFSLGTTDRTSWKGLGSHYKTPQNPAAVLHPLL